MMNKSNTITFVTLLIALTQAQVADECIKVARSVVGNQNAEADRGNENVLLSEMQPDMKLS